MARSWSARGKVYSATLKRDLFGDWVIFKFWAANKRVSGNTETECVSSYEAGLDRLEEIAEGCSVKGYTEVF